MKKIIFLFVIFSFQMAFAQVTEFRLNAEEFADDVEKHLTAYDKKFAKDLAKEILPIYSSNYNEEQRKAIVDIANQMLAKNVRVSPDFINYFNAVAKFGASKLFTNEEFKNWEEILGELLKQRNTKRLLEFIDFSSNFFEKNVIYESSSVQWRLSKGSYKFSFDKVPFVTFSNSDITCEAKNNKSTIYGTEGEYNVSTNQFLGKGGQLTWERVKLPKEETYAVLTEYKVSFKSPGFRADSVQFHTPYFANPIWGKINEKVVTLRDAESANYPYFTSYAQTLEIKNIFPDIDYVGGFSMEGLNLRGGASGGDKASITVNKKGRPFMVIEAKNFKINSKEIASSNSRATIFVYGGDIISHPNANFNYTKETEEFVLTREGEGNIKSPFESTFHQLDMNFEALYWKKGEDVINFGYVKGNDDKTASFESKDFFSFENFNQFQGMKQNMLRELYKYHIDNEEAKEISGVEFANKMKSTVEQIEPIYAKMVNMGIIYYDKYEKTIYIKDRLRKYVKASSKKGDYDNIQINSEVKSGHNAVLNLTNNDLTINGIRGFNVSELKTVKIFPKGGTIVVRKNRDIEFSGVLNAGRAEFFAENLSFVYDDFKVNMPLVDSLRLRVLPINNRIEQKQVRLLSHLEKLQGTIYLDDPKNKSGIDTGLLDFPKVNITNESYIYYDQKFIYRGAYNRNDFKFKVYPFKMDSLSFFETSGVEFKGKLYAAGIIPDMETSLTVQQDYALGFRKKEFKSKIYDNRADYANLLVLDGGGLQGKGDLSFLTSSAKSNDIVFFIDSLIADAYEYKNKEQAANPNVPTLEAVDVFVMYQPKKGIWHTESRDSLIQVFNDDITELKGKITLTQAGMTGEGTLSFNTIEVLSSTFKFKRRIVDADVCEFIIKGKDPQDPMSFQAINMNMHIDFDTRIGEFVSNDGNSFLEFPDNKYICFMDKFQWFMDSEEMGLANNDDTTGFDINTDLQITEPNFFSTHPKQDSLAFASNEARYDLKTKTLTCRNIDFIAVADSWVYPDSGVLVIKRRANYETLKNAEILTNSVTKYHRFKRAEVDLVSKKKYEGKGYYTVSNDTSVFSEIYFNKIEPNEEQITLAEGEVGQSDNFNISPQFKYYGKAYINASKLGVEYVGKTSIVNSCQTDDAAGWLDFTATVDTSNILIPLGEDFEELTSGLMIYSLDSIGYYGSFLGKKQNKTDHAITPAKGWLGYDHEKKEFQIGDKEKLKEITMPGNFVSLNVETCSIYADGLIDFANGLGQLDVKPIGTLSYDTTQAEALKIKSSMIFNFPFSDDALKAMAENIKGLPNDDPLDLTASNYDMIVKNALETKKSDKVISDLNLYGKMKDMPKELESSFTVLDIDVTWNEEKKSFLGSGMCGISNVLDEQLFKKCKLYFQLEKRRNGDVLHLYLEPFAGVFYYFTYKAGLFQAVSSNSTFNSILADVKPSKATIKAKGDIPSFQYSPCSKSKPLLFLRLFEELEENKADEEEGIIEEEKIDTEEIKEEKKEEEDDW